MRHVSEYKVAIFDCDGVILDSNQVKTKAFALALAGEDPELVNELVEYHKRNGGISRYIKFEYFFKTIKAQSNYQIDLASALDRYGVLSKKGLLSCNEIPGIRDTLEGLKELNIPCYVNSGGDQEEVRAVLGARGLDQYFVGILGSPKTKIENLSSLDKVGRLQAPALFFGDARSDYDASKEFGLDFVFVSAVSEWSEGRDVCRNSMIKMVRDFSSFTF